MILFVVPSFDGVEIGGLSSGVLGDQRKETIKDTGSFLPITQDHPDGSFNVKNIICWALHFLFFCLC